MAADMIKAFLLRLIITFSCAAAAENLLPANGRPAIKAAEKLTALAVMLVILAPFELLFR